MTGTIQGLATGFAYDIGRTLKGTAELLGGTVGLGLAKAGVKFEDGTVQHFKSTALQGVTDLTKGALGFVTHSLATAGSVATYLGDQALAAIKTDNPFLQTPQKLAQVTVSLIDTISQHPAKMFDVATGIKQVGVTESSAAAVRSALGAVQGDGSIPQQTKDLLNDITSLTPKKGLKESEDFTAEIFHGAHIVVNDGGERYDSWVGQARDLGVQNRSSSHYDSNNPLHSGDQQKGIDLPGGLGHLLFGTSRNPETGEKSTWFQIEAHGTTAREMIPHLADWAVHKASGDSQVAPFGYSVHTEKEPHCREIVTE